MSHRGVYSVGETAPEVREERVIFENRSVCKKMGIHKSSNQRLRVPDTVTRKKDSQSHLDHIRTISRTKYRQTYLEVKGSLLPYRRAGSRKSSNELSKAAAPIADTGLRIAPWDHPKRGRRINNSSKGPKEAVEQLTYRKPME